jgi:hypothetical protein
MQAILELVEEAAGEAWNYGQGEVVAGSTSAAETRLRLRAAARDAGVVVSFADEDLQITHPPLSVKSHQQGDPLRVRRAAVAVRYLRGALPANEHSVWIRVAYRVLRAHAER